MEAKPTGDYRLYKQKPGESGQIELIKDTLEKVNKYLELNRAKEEEGRFKIFKQEEVIYERNAEEGENTHGWRNVSLD